MAKYKNNRGFVLITLLIALAIIAIWAAIYFGKSGGGTNIITTGNKAIEQTKQNNQLQQQDWQQTQNELNGVDSSAAPADHSATDKAKAAVQLQNQTNSNSVGQ